MTGLVLLTGATGFVGRNVFGQLTEAGARVRLIVRRGKEDQFKDLPNVEAIIVTDDLFAQTQTEWEQACEGVDTIIHVAWYVEPGKHLTDPANLDCLGGTITFAKAAVAMDVRRFIGIGTCFEYDLSEGDLATDTLLKPLSLYGGCKAATYLTLDTYLSPLGVEFAWCRLFFLHGEGDDKRRLVSHIREKLSNGLVAELTSGEQQRDYLDVIDAARMIVETALGDEQGAVNICSGEGPTVRELAEKIADEYGRRDLLNFGARPPNSFDPPRIVGVRKKKTGDLD